MSNPDRSIAEKLEQLWDRRRARLARAVILIAVLVGGVILIEVARWVGGSFAAALPKVHLAAITWAITVLLFFEFVEMAFAMSNSVASSVARHLQLYALVLLRDAFLKLESFPEPIEVTLENLHYIGIMTSDAGAGILLFAIAVLFERMQPHVPLTSHGPSLRSFRFMKQMIVLPLLATIAGLCVYSGISMLGMGPRISVVDTYFTVLIFVDMLLAFASLAFADRPAIVFRNFGFAFAAILLRLALASPEFIRPGLGLAGGLTAIAIAAVYNLALSGKLGPPPPAAAAPEDELIAPV